MSIDPNRIKVIFWKAVEQCEPGKWDAFLDAACEGDANLRRRVELLLEARLGKDSLFDAQNSMAPPTLDQPVAEGPGTVIGPYKLLQQIGEGGVGVVYMADQTEPIERRVALKIIKPSMDSRQVISRFEAEEQALEPRFQVVGVAKNRPTLKSRLPAGESVWAHGPLVISAARQSARHLNPT